MTKTISLILLGLTFVWLGSCKKKSEDPQPEVIILPPPVTEAPSKEQLKKDFLTTYANISFSTFTEANATALALQSAIDAFTASPSAAKFAACKEAYTLSRKAYLQGEVFRGVDGSPIEEVEGWLNSWPLNEGYIDYLFNTSNTDTAKVAGKYNGIINDPVTYPDITKTILLGLNLPDGGGESDIAIGFHAIEFLLWGQDVYAASAGQRPFEDYITGSGATAPNGARRSVYLKECAKQLVENISFVKDQWDPSKSGNYRAQFLNSSTANVDARLKAVLSSMAKLANTEFGGERITPALELPKDERQEEEHSCFSDLTKLDFKYDVTGFANIIYGTHKLESGIQVVNGTGLKTLMDSFSAENAAKVKVTIDSMTTTSEAVYNTTAPYDQIIIRDDPDADRTKVKEMSNAWKRFSIALSASSQALGFGVIKLDE